jgi:hypothetical protein
LQIRQLNPFSPGQPVAQRQRGDNRIAPEQLRQQAGMLGGTAHEADVYRAVVQRLHEEADSKNLAYLKHDAQAAAKAWDKTLAFLHKNLA